MKEAQELPAYLTSPGEAFSHQAKEERKLERALERATLDMLLKVKSDALKGNLTMARTVGDWNRAVTRAVRAYGITDDEVGFSELHRGLLDASLGDEAYSTAMAVLTKAQETYPAPSKKEISQTLDEALSLDTPSMVAAGFSLLDRLRKLGAPWRVRVKRTVRTGFTGMMGVLALSALRTAGWPRKKWVTRHDDAVRPTHMAVDGKVLKLGESFNVGGASLQYPGDRSGPIHETINCRCVIIGDRD